MANGEAGDLKTRIRMQIIVSLAILGVALWVVVSKQYDETYVKWAIGSIGLVSGYWLR